MTQTEVPALALAMPAHIARLFVNADASGDPSDMNHAMMSAKRAHVADVRPYYVAAAKGDRAGAMRAIVVIVATARKAA